jgi:hypothetical protein
MGLMSGTSASFAGGVPGGPRGMGYERLCALPVSLRLVGFALAASPADLVVREPAVVQFGLLFQDAGFRALTLCFSFGEISLDAAVLGVAAVAISQLFALALEAFLLTRTPQPRKQSK